MPCGLGWDLVCLFGMAPVYFTFTVLVDVLKNYPKVYRKFMVDPVVKDRPIEEDDDVAKEAARVTSPASLQNDVVRLVQLRKVYGGGQKPKVAVRGVRLGIPRGECFGWVHGGKDTVNMFALPQSYPETIQSVCAPFPLPFHPIRASPAIAGISASTAPARPARSRSSLRTFCRRLERRSLMGLTSWRTRIRYGR